MWARHLGTVIGSLPVMPRIDRAHPASVPVRLTTQVTGCPALDTYYVIGWLSSLAILRIQHDRDWTIIHDVNLHHRLEIAGLHPYWTLLGRIYEVLIQYPRLV